jgi:hypothetical protein
VFDTEGGIATRMPHFEKLLRNLSAERGALRNGLAIRGMRERNIFSAPRQS